ncbi:MAG: type I methionyl aminopeptidase [Spirochaetales bacterium]|nr:type I methionyl aminopeptidase [Spirochaetales bacterium]
MFSRFMDDIHFKTSIDVAHIRKSCQIVEKTICYLSSFIHEGITTLELDNLAGDFLKKHHCRSAIKGHQGYPAHICTSVNQVAAHGVPDHCRLKQGDLLSIDIAVEYNGWYGDGAWTFWVDKQGRHPLVAAAWKSLIAGIAAVRAGNTLGDVGEAVSNMARRLGYYVVEDFVGHGIGQQLHEGPKVPHIGKSGQGITIKPGMVFTIEPALVTINSPLTLLTDQWSLKADQALSAQFEQTIAVFKDRIEILTLSSKKLLKSIDYPPEI